MRRIFSSRRRYGSQNWPKSFADKANDAGAKQGDFVFTSHRECPIRETKLVRRYFKPLLESAGLPNIRLYDLRHTAATLALAASVSPKVVSKQLEHASVAFTLEVYSHVLPHLQDEAAMGLSSF